jgi:hypothetical protein
MQHVIQACGFVHSDMDPSNTAVPAVEQPRQLIHPRHRDFTVKLPGWQQLMQHLHTADRQVMLHADVAMLAASGLPMAARGNGCLQPAYNVLVC